MKNFSNYIVGLVIISLVALMPGCVSDQISPEEIIVPENVSFSGDIIPIFDASCNFQGCHSTNGIPPDLTPEAAWVNLVYLNYVDTVTTENSILWKKIDTGGSMEPYVTDQDKALILSWIEQDAPEN